jgi:hypothetical protein
MGASIQEIINSLPEKPPRSRLEPYRELIEELLRRGRTYREIRKVLAEKCGLRIALSTLHGFVAPHLQATDRTPPQFAPILRTKSIERRAPTGKQCSDGNTNQGHTDEVRQRIEALKQRELTERNPDGFAYDPDQPLRLVRNSGKGISGG